MKILIVSQFYFPEPFQKIKDLAESLTQKGHEVTVLTGVPNYPTGYIYQDYRDGKNRFEQINDVEIVRAALIPRKRTKIGLALNYLSWALSASFKVLFLKKKFDVVMCYQTSPVLMLLPAWLAKLKNRCKLFGYVLDLWPVSMLTLLKTETDYLYVLMGGVSRFLYKKCDLIAVTSKPFIDYLSQTHGLDSSKIRYLPQHGNDAYLSENFDVDDKSRKRFLFAGNMGHAQDLDTILKAVTLLRDRDFVIDFVGTGSEYKHCVEYVKKNKLTHWVKFHGAQKYTDLPCFYSRATACLVTLKHENAVGLTLPGKVQDYLAVGKPLIGAIDGEAMRVIQESGCGICVHSGDFVGLANAFCSFLENPNLYSECGKRARDYYISNFTREKTVAELLSLLSLCSKRD